jgi:two-component system, OmpR family, sensor histidine kinase KdpD
MHESPRNEPPGAEPARPDPDRLLEQLKEQERRSTKGRLKIFFGYVAGVGKTYAMLEAAQRQAAAGVDVVVGYVETHGRAETDALLEGLEVLPPLEAEYRGITLREFDLDAALARHPEVLLVDELAHTNAPGLRHTKRWHDVKDLLDAGVGVYTTLNVQHLESLNDVIKDVTGVQVRETVPDSIFDEADSVEVVDLPPGELLQRLKQGKIYIAAQASRAMENFFKGPNLGALREVTLRRTADRTHVHLENARAAPGGRDQSRAVSDTLLVCVGPSPTSAKVIRVSKRMAAATSARWIAAGVETTRRRALSDAQRASLLENIRLAERLGAETTTLVGDNVAEEIVSYAESQLVTRIVIGKSGQPRWRGLVSPNIVDQVLRQSGSIDVYVIQGMSDGGEQPLPARRPRTPWTRYLAAFALVAVAGAIAALLEWAGLSEANKAVVFLPAVVLAAMWWGMGPGVLAAILSVLAFDFFFVPPYYTFAVRDVEYVVTLVVLAAVALLVGTLAARLRRQVQTSRSRENRLEVLYRLSRALSGVSGTHQLALAAQREVAGIFRGAVHVYLPHGSVLEPVISNDGGQVDPEKPGQGLAVATWAFEHSHVAGMGTGTLPDSRALYLPLVTPESTVGVLAVELPGAGALSPENRQLLETIAAQIALAIERDRLAEQHRSALVDAETERMRSSLLSSVSHDLRTPLAVIAGTSSTLLEMGEAADAPTRTALLTEIYDESNRLTRLVENLLSMTRLESEVVALERDWFPLEDVVGSALRRLRAELGGRAVEKHLPADLPLVSMDGVLLEQVLFNLLDNALKYSPEGSPIDISASVEGGSLLVRVADRGLGLAGDEAEKVFEKLYRGSAARSGRRGAGLGLAIARAIIDAHGGKVWAENRPEGGAAFSFSLPLGPAPSLPDEEGEGTE